MFSDHERILSRFVPKRAAQYRNPKAECCLGHWAVFSIVHFGVRLWWVQEGQVTHFHQEQNLKTSLSLPWLCFFWFLWRVPVWGKGWKGDSTKGGGWKPRQSRCFSNFLATVGGNSPWTAQVSACFASKALTALFLNFIFKAVHITSLKDKDKSFSRVKGRHACNPP